MSSWIPEITHHAPGKPFILGMVVVVVVVARCRLTCAVATKTDLRDDRKTIMDLEKLQQTPVSYQQGLKLAKEIGAAGFVECSALRGSKVNEVFETAMRVLIEGRSKPPKKRSMCSIM